MKPAKPKSDRKKKVVPGVLAPGELYTLPEAMARLGVGEWWMRTARDNGLNVLYVSGRGFVTGAALIGHIASVGTAQKNGSPDQGEPKSRATGEVDGVQESS